MSLSINYPKVGKFQYLIGTVRNYRMNYSLNARVARDLGFQYLIGTVRNFFGRASELPKPKKTRAERKAFQYLIGTVRNA
jgi:hypothetical protein